MSKKVKIYIDGLPLVDGHFSGVGQYVLGIVKGFDELIKEQFINGEEPLDIRVIIPYDMVDKFRKYGMKYVSYVTYPLPFRIMSGLWRRGLLVPLDLLFGRGIYIFSNFVKMPLLFSKSILVIYDISFELYRQYSDENNAKFLSKAVRKSIKKVDKIITISKNAKKEIVKFYNLSEDFVKVATPATDPKLFYRRPDREIKKIKEKYDIDGDYILSLSNLEPRKNLDTLVDAYCSLPKKITNTTSLLIVGINGWKTSLLFDKIVNKVKKGYNITRPSKYIEDEDKPAILSGAKALIYPSHYEGFGMPPLEALACGTPVITSNNSSLPEAVGNVGIMLDSKDTIGIAQAIKDILNKPNRYKNIKISGPQHVKNFSWLESARVYLDTIKDISV